METNNKTKKETRDKYYWLILIIGVMFIVSAPCLLTISAHWKWFDFSDTGEIGDTIGGVTAPIVGTLGAVLIYLSFREQREANRIQIDALNEEKNRIANQNEFEFIYKYYTEEIKNYSFKDNLKLNIYFDCLKSSKTSFYTSENRRIYIQQQINIISDFFYISQFFMRKLLTSENTFKKELATIYIIDHYRKYSTVSLPEKNTEEYEYLEKEFPEFLFLFRNWDLCMKELNNIYTNQITNLYPLQ